MIGAPGKSGRFLYYQCHSAIRQGPEVCKGCWLPKAKIEGFVIERLKEKLLTDENLTDLVKMVNAEIRLLTGQRRERLEGVDRQLRSVNQKLLKLYIALETGKLDLDDLAPRIKQLRAEQIKLQRARDEASAELEERA